jgi:hypothetical protein
VRGGDAAARVLLGGVRYRRGGFGRDATGLLTGRDATGDRTGESHDRGGGGGIEDRVAL